MASVILDLVISGHIWFILNQVYVFFADLNRADL